jgi:hypothetical protein
VRHEVFPGLAKVRVLAVLAENKRPTIVPEPIRVHVDN